MVADSSRKLKFQRGCGWDGLVVARPGLGTERGRGGAAGWNSRLIPAGVEINIPADRSAVPFGDRELRLDAGLGAAGSQVPRGFPSEAGASEFTCGSAAIRRDSNPAHTNTGWGGYFGKTGCWRDR